MELLSPPAEPSSQNFTFHKHAAAAGGDRPGGGAGGVSIEVAETDRQIEDAWRLVYDAYRTVGFIQPNPYGMHAARQAMGDHCAVIVARSGRAPVSTITSIADADEGLPLDCVCGEELDELRQPGRKLLEIGLFADRRQSWGNSFSTLLELMRYAFWFGQACGTTDYVCGIPPRRARLYRHIFGFEPIGPVKRYATVCDNPVQLMHVRMEYIQAHHARHRATNYFMINPVEAGEFDHRFDFTAASISRSRLRYFLDYKQRQAGGYMARAGA